jgi:hypothetical protein
MDDPDVELPRLLFCDSEKGARHGIVQEIVPSDDCTCQVTAPEYKEIFTLRRRYIPWRRRLAISKINSPASAGFSFLEHNVWPTTKNLARHHQRYCLRTQLTWIS